MRKHQPKTPTTCDISDMIGEIVSFINDTPLWYEDDDARSAMMRAYTVLTRMASPEMVTDEEAEFILNIHATISENKR